MTEFGDELAKRQSEFEEWRKNVRDPAERLSEGKRWIRSSDGKTTICYEIAQLGESRFAIRYRMEYGSGSMSGRSSPWSAYPSRQECIDNLLKAARCHFGPELVASNCNEIQRRARNQILELLDGGLFGFIEPAVEVTRE